MSPEAPIPPPSYQEKTRPLDVINNADKFSPQTLADWLGRKHLPIPPVPKPNFLQRLVNRLSSPPPDDTIIELDDPPPQSK